MNEMIAMPSVVLLILGTALLSAVVTTALPSLPNYWGALKNSIKRVFTREKHNMDIIDVVIITKLQEVVRENSKNIMDLGNQVDNLAEALSTRDKNRKSNIRRDVRDYLKELQK